MDRGNRAAPMLIAHRGGNSRRALRAALAADVDWLETDVWLHYGRLVARHDRSIWRLPLTYGRRSLALHLAPALVLSQVLDEARAHGRRVLIDLKGSAAGLPGEIARLLVRRDALDSAALCGQHWAALEAARTVEPRVEVVYSLGRPEHLTAYLARLRAGTAPTTTSCFHGLLTAERVRELKDAGATILAWTVDREERARELLSWGVEGITSNRYRMLAGLRADLPGADPR